MTVNVRWVNLVRTCAVGLLVGVGAAGCRTDQPPLTPGDHTFSIRHAGRSRSYLLHVPPQIDAATDAMPLVLMLHGGTGTAEGAARLYGWLEKSDAAGFLVAFPQGVSRTWNAMHCCGPANRQEVDDVGFIVAVIDEIASRADVDRRRVFATGMSNGAMLAYRLAAERPGQFAAIAPVAGAIGGQASADAPLEVIPQAGQPVAIVIFHGELDQRVRFDGGPTTSNLSPGRMDLSVADAVAFWVQANGASATPVVTTNDTGRVIHSRHAAADGYGDVELYAITDRGHAWPGGHAPAVGGVEIGDPPTMEISATDLIWDFFAAHPKPGP